MICHHLRGDVGIRVDRLLLECVDPNPRDHKASTNTRDRSRKAVSISVPIISGSRAAPAANEKPSRTSGASARRPA